MPHLQVKLVDYGVGNAMSIVRAYEAIDIECLIARTPEAITGTTPLILGGVGRFDDAMRKLRAGGMLDAILEAVTVKGAPLLGICLGMQLLTQGSEEGDCEGLSLIEGRTVRFRLEKDAKLPVPHIGWNTAESPRQKGPQIIPEGEYYFNHSYHIEAAGEATLTATTYGYSFPSAIRKGAIFGVQFHPEKSRTQGTELLRRFAAYPTPA